MFRGAFHPPPGGQEARRLQLTTEAEWRTFITGLLAQAEAGAAGGKEHPSGSGRALGREGAAPRAGSVLAMDRRRPASSLFAWLYD